MVNNFLLLEGSVVIAIVLILIRQRDLNTIKKFLCFYNNVTENKVNRDTLYTL